MGKTEPNDIEIYIEWWMNEMIDHEFIHSYTRETETFVLFPPYVAERKVHLKTKVEKETYSLLGKIKYTYDYKIRWTQKAMYLFFQPSDFSNHRILQTMVYKETFFQAHWSEQERCFVSYIDVKPPSKVVRIGNQSMSSFYTFPVKQAILLWLHGIYVNKVIPIPMKNAGKTLALFPNTFTPKRYLITDGATRTRKIRFRIRSIAQYVQSRTNEINRINALVKSIKDKQVSQGDLFNN